jgi:hypothetical protein
VSREILVQFVRFEAKALVREYTFNVREPEVEPRVFTLTISNQAFNERRVRYQDAPDVCSVKLRHELAAYANDPPWKNFLITDADLEDYRSRHAPRASRPWSIRRPNEDF